MARFVLYVGPMFSGKTTRLLAELDRYKYKNKRILLLKPDMDRRYFHSKICTHSGSVADGVGVNNITEIASLNPFDYDVIAIDEAFMIPNIDQMAISLYSQGKIVLISSLDLSSSLLPFPEISRMMPYATEICKCNAVCGVKNCYQNAFLTYKIEGVGKKDSGEIEIGGAEMYEPRCCLHHPILASFKHLS